MKKIFILFLFFILILPEKTQALFGENESLNLYFDIADGIEEYQKQLTFYEFRWGFESQDITTHINNQLEIDGIGRCIKDNASEKDILTLIENKNINLNILTDECKQIDGKSIWVKEQSDILLAITNIYKYAQQKAEKKIDQINSVGNIGIYSDWIKENSWFDLINDLSEINAIIFASSTEYQWEEYNNFSENFRNKLNNSHWANISNINGRIHLIQDDNLVSSIWNEINESIQNDSIYYSEYACNDTNRSGLSWNSLDTLFGTDNTQDTWYKRLRWDDEYIVWSSDLLQWDFSSKYVKVNDNTQWPCNWFFCIAIDFITYNHNLLGGWDNITIEYLLNRSNKHLGKFAWSSLLPSNMTINNFELGFKGLQLSDLLHLGIQVSTKPVPILQLDKKNKKDNSELAAHNMMFEYYKSIWLDYDRRNDLSIYNARDFEQKSLLNAESLSNTDAEKKYNQYLIQRLQESEKITFINNQIQKIAAESSLSQFNLQLSELEQFTHSIKNYIETIDKIIKGIKNIPTDIN